MSMNINIRGKRLIQVIKTGKIETQGKFIHVMQTPTKVSYELIKGKTFEKQLNNYFEYVKSLDMLETEYTYEEDDIFQEKPPIKEELVDYGEIHIKEIKEEIEALKKQGYEFEMFIM
jgi:hypothetical protein